MILKDCFRMQKKLDELFSQAQSSLTDRNHALKVTKTHLRKASYSEAEDMVEEVDVGEFTPNDDVVRFMLFLIDEKDKLSRAIGEMKAKALCNIDIDAAIETNKLRQRFKDSVNRMVMYTKSKKIERGVSYKFSNEGVQTPFNYDIESNSIEAYDRDVAKSAVKTVITKSDEISREIDKMMVTGKVNYESLFDFNDSFEDCIKTFLFKA